MPFPQFSLTKGSLCNCTISLCSYSGVYMNRGLIVYQQLHCAVFSDSYLLILLAHYRAHWNYWRWLYNFRILCWLNSIWVVKCLYSTVATETLRISASFHTVLGQTATVTLNSRNFQFIFILLLSSNYKIYSDLFRLTLNKWPLFGKLSCEGHTKLHSQVFANG